MYAPVEIFDVPHYTADQAQLQGVKKVRRHHSKVPWVHKKVMLFMKLPYNKKEGTMKFFQRTDVCFISNC